VKDQSSRTALATHAAAPQAAADAAPLRELHEQLASLHTLMKQLAELAGEKLAAMRRADTATLDRCTAREAELVKTVFGSEAKRKALLARIAQSLHLPQPERAKLGEIAERLPEPSASALRARNAALREIAAELQQKNRLAAKVAQNLQSHIRGVFAELAGAAQETPVYGPRGQHEGRRPRCWVEAVG
jgi:flagellar biosynthesis/type III secretory pathway chaperone